MMKTLGLLATLTAKPGKEAELELLLTSALTLAEAEHLTLTWYSFKVNGNTFGIFDTFETEQGRQAHLNGSIAAALMAKADELLDKPPIIETVSILGAK